MLNWLQSNIPSRFFNTLLEPNISNAKITYDSMSMKQSLKIVSFKIFIYDGYDTNDNVRK